MAASGAPDSFTILADDLTGALDSAAVFARHGMKPFVATSGRLDEWPHGDVVSLNLDTRRLDAAEATGVVADAVGRVDRSGGSLRYLKIDSTLRGHPGTEIEFAAISCEAALVIVSPSFPAMGRTVVGGELLVHGVPLAETEVGRDSLSPVASSSVGEVLAQHCSLAIRQVSIASVRGTGLAGELADLAAHGAAGAPSVVVCDAESEEDLARLVSAAQSIESDGGELSNAAPSSVLFVGSAGLASALARSMSGKIIANSDPTPSLRSPILVVTASQRSLASEQVDALVDAGMATKHRVDFDIDFGGNVTPARLDLSAVTETLDSGHHAALQARVTSDLATVSPQEVRSIADSVTAHLAEIVSDLVSDRAIGGLVIIGGDTAHALLDRLGARGIFLASEPLDGVPVGAISGGALDGVTVATKAGAFGDTQTLVDLFTILTEDGVPS